MLIKAKGNQVKILEPYSDNIEAATHWMLKTAVKVMERVFFSV